MTTNSADLKVLGALLALSLAIGGAGVSSPVLHLVLQVSALAAATYFVTSRRTWDFPRLSWAALALVGAILLLPALQLVPLPPSVWTQIPGRTLPAFNDAALGIVIWRPLSLDVEGTVRSSLTLIPAMVIFAGCMFIPRSSRAQLLWVVLAVALVSAVLGIAQLATAGSMTPYPSTHSGYSIGLFVNRNHNAVLMLVSMPVSAALASSQIARGKSQSVWLIASLSMIFIFAVTVVGTTSRAGLLLLPLAIAASLILLFNRRAPLRLVALSLLGVAAVVGVVLGSTRFDQAIGRFSGLSDSRFDYWRDVQWALDHYGLAGTGIGTFEPVYKSAESLEAVVPQVINHAHNDYLEIILEGGIPAVVLILAFVAIITAALLGLLRYRSRPERSAITVAAFVGVLILLLASIVDYPLRMPALSTVFALFCALLFRDQALPPPLRSGSTSKRLPSKSERQPLRLAALVVGLPVIAALSLLAIQASISARELQNNRAEAALSLAGWSTRAHERLATLALLRNDLATALSHAHAANRLSPISAPAIRSIGLVHLSRGEIARGNRIMQRAAVLGWRDPLTQLWAIEAAKSSSEPDKALQRAEALFRQSLLFGPATTQLLTSTSSSEMAVGLAERLSAGPQWRRHFFNSSAALPPTAADGWIRLVETLNSSRAPVSIAEGNPSLNALIKAGRIDEAQRLWLVLHSKHGFVSNGDFEAVPDESRASYPAHWEVPPRNRRFVRVRASPQNPDNRALHIRSTEDGTIVAQRLLLQPGSYRFSYRVQVSSPVGFALRWELRCGNKGSRQVADTLIPPGRGWQESAAAFTVPIRDCPIQRLALRRSGATPVQNVWLDEIKLERVHR